MVAPLVAPRPRQMPRIGSFIAPPAEEKALVVAMLQVARVVLEVALEDLQQPPLAVVGRLDALEPLFDIGKLVLERPGEVMVRRWKANELREPRAVFVEQVE